MSSLCGSTRFTINKEKIVFVFVASSMLIVPTSLLLDPRLFPTIVRNRQNNKELAYPSQPSIVVELLYMSPC